MQIDAPVAATRCQDHSSELFRRSSMRSVELTGQNTLQRTLCLRQCVWRRGDRRSVSSSSIEMLGERLAAPMSLTEMAAAGPARDHGYSLGRTTWGQTRRRVRIRGDIREGRQGEPRTADGGEETMVRYSPPPSSFGSPPHTTVRDLPTSFHVSSTRACVCG